MKTTADSQSKKRVTIHDVARRTGYSITVISHALNNNARINKQTRAYIKRIAERMGYRPNIFAVNLVLQRSRMIGALVPGILTSFYPEVIHAIMTNLKKSHYDFIVMISNDRPKEERQALDILQQRRIDGLILVPCMGGDNRAIYREMIRNGMPIVMMDRWLPRVNCHTVTTDNVKGGYIATTHLLNLGHERIGVIRHGSDCSSTSERLEGYRQALHEHGLAFEKALIRTVHYNIGHDQYVNADECLQAFLATNRPPTALFVLHDTIAVGIIHSAMKAGIRIPEDLSIVGYDDLEILDYLSVPLTTVAQNKEAIGHRCVSILTQICSGQKLPLQNVRLLPQLRLRKSTCLIKK